MFSYKDLQQYVFDFSYGTALGDAIGQKAFEGNKKPLRDYDEAKIIAKKYIDGILSGENPDIYTTAYDLEKSFQNFINNNLHSIEYKSKNGQLSKPVFRFGNAQKLLNMLAKNMFVLVYQNESLRDNFKHCHCPMDNVMIKTVKDELKKDCTKEAKNLLLEFKKSENSSWSRIEQNDITQYEKFQKCVSYLAAKEGVSSVEYDYLMWKKASSLNAE